MPAYSAHYFVRMTSATNRETNRPYGDWRSQYVGKSGLLVIFTSRKLRPGDHFAYFFPGENKTEQQYLRTGTGKLEENNDTITLTTSDSIYIFSKDEDGLPEYAKLELQANCLPRDLPEYKMANLALLDIYNKQG